MPLRKFTLQGVDFEIGNNMLNAPLEAAIEKGIYSAAEAREVRALLRPDDVYCEIGAGVGFLSTLAARIVGAEDRVHAYEANPDLIPVIKRTWKANSVKGSVYHCLLGTGTGESDFHVAKAFWASSAHIAYASSTTIKVPQRDFLQQLDKKAVTFLAMDAQGGERDLLDKWLPPRVRCVVARFHPRIIGNEPVAALWRCLEEQGFHQMPQHEPGPVRTFVRRRHS